MNCKLCGFPLMIAEDGEILKCVVCDLKKRILSLEMQYQALQEFAVSAPISIPGVLEHFSELVGDTEEFRKQCTENYDKLINNILLQLKSHRDNLKWIKDRIR